MRCIARSFSQRRHLPAIALSFRSIDFALAGPACNTEMKGRDGSSPSLSATHIWTPPVSRVELLTRFGTRLQSYIRPAYRASDEALALMDFRALRSADQSGGLSRPCVATEFGSAGPTGSPSASHKTHPTQPRQERFFSAPISLWPHAVLRPALSQPGVESRGAKLRA